MIWLTYLKMHGPHIIRAKTCDFQQCGILTLTSVDSDEPAQPTLSLETPNGVQFVA